MAFLYVTPLFLGAVFGIWLVILIAQNRPVPGARTLAFMIWGAVIWSVGYALEILAPTLEAKLLWAKLQYFGIVVLPVAWYIFAVQYLAQPGRSLHSLKYRVLLLVIPMITLALVWTNELHRLVWSHTRLQTVGPLLLLEVEHGLWFLVFTLFNYCLFILGTARLVFSLHRSTRRARWQIVLVLIASLLPFLGNVIYLTHFNLVQYLDWTPFSFIVSVALIAFSLFRLQFANILPIAQKTVFAGLSESLLILDNQNELLYLNRAAEDLIGQPAESIYERPLDELLPEVADWVNRAGRVEECQVEVVRGEAPAQRFYDLNISTLYGWFKRPVGRLLVLHEITELIQEQERLETARSHLEEVVAERTETLRQTVEQLQRELIERSLVEQRFEEVVESSPDAILLVDQFGFIRLANAQAERLFGYQREELVDKHIEILMPEPRRRMHRDHLMRYVNQPHVRQLSDTLDLTVIRKDGSQFPAEIGLGPLNKDGAVWVACNVRNISQRKSAEAERNRLLQELQRSHEQLQALTYRLQEVREAERRQIASELHDQVGQNLTGLSLNLTIVENSLIGEANLAVRGRLQDSLRLVEETTRKVRDVMADLHPPVLDEYGLVSALSWYSAQYSRRTGLDIQVTGEPIEPRLPLDVEMALFRLAQEALNNVAKHAQASLVEITVESTDHSICLTVRDDGSGFDTQALDHPSAQPHWGFLSMEQRAASIGGHLTIQSAPGKGTSITVQVKKGEVHDQSISGR
ncbi:MAG: PAS domain S-box protein [Anaerolineales bacterium]|jgi:PAS domain S-box-containing protein|nr:PAS domain S-box protein [Anaerolineales bacterium]